MRRRRQERNDDGEGSSPDQQENGSRNNSTQDDDYDEEEELKYGFKSVMMLIIPVSLCLFVVVATVTSVTYYSQSSGQYL